MRATVPGMHGWKVVGLVFLMGVVPAAWSGVQTSANNKAGSAPATQVSLAKAQQKLAQQQAQVRQLQGALAKQESDSKQASQRLQQQDQAVAKMQQELQMLQAKQPPAHR